MINRSVETLFLIIVITLLKPFNCDAIEFKGVNYTGWSTNAYSTPDSNLSLARAKDAGCQWISVNVFWFQDTVTSTVIEPNYRLYSVSPGSVKVAVDRCHQLGLKVMLKPNVDLAHPLAGQWRGNILPSDAWFEGYNNFISYWADFAEANNVEMLCIGCELNGTISWADSWRDVANNVRTHFSRPIVYAADHDYEQSVSWWDALDYIGIDAYYSLTDSNDSNLAQLTAAWVSRANSIGSWRNANWPNKNVIFTEVGYGSYDGSNRHPWHSPSTEPLDINEQTDCYNALLSVCTTRNWWAGVFWWSWKTDPNAGGPADINTTPQNKPAQQVLTDYYTTITGDLDDDKDVDLNDLTLFCDHWPDQNIVGWPDFNNDHGVNFTDFALLGANW
ncbi:MAG: hypothetical protein ABSB91_00580 [Sedimentisphaerales bacterium]|jgi:hypothetical protein